MIVYIGYSINRIIHQLHGGISFSSSASFIRDSPIKDNPTGKSHTSLFKNNPPAKDNPLL